MLRKKTGKVQYRWQNEELVPKVRFSGKWLRTLGFHVDTRFEMKAAPGYIFLRALGTTDVPTASCRTASGAVPLQVGRDRSQ